MKSIIETVIIDAEISEHGSKSELQRGPQGNSNAPYMDGAPS